MVLGLEIIHALTVGYRGLHQGRHHMLRAPMFCPLSLLFW